MTKEGDLGEINALWYRAVNEEVSRNKGPCGPQDVQRVRVVTSEQHAVRTNDGLFVKSVKLCDGPAAWSKEGSFPAAR